MTTTELHIALKRHREASGLTTHQVASSLILAPGWVDAWEEGQLEPPLALLNQLLKLYDVELGAFFTDVDLGLEALAFERNLVVEDDDGTLRLLFPMGGYKASLRWEGATKSEAVSLLGLMRAKLNDGNKNAKSRAVVETFQAAVKQWPNVNPSDIWYFLIPHAYQDQYNHPVTEAGRDLSQSWKRTGGWAFERIICEHYEPFLRQHNVWLEIPSAERKRALIEPMGLTNFQTAMEKADVLAVGNDGSQEHCFGVVHAKASLAERRTDDAPLSRELLQKGFVSPLVTMDCKANPAPLPINRGEFGSEQGGQRVSEKRLDIERQNIFDAAFSFNSNTIPTPRGASAASRIHVVDFNDPNDSLGTHIVNKWRLRHGMQPLPAQKI